jgi:YVTN family beta-propeller protein
VVNPRAGLKKFRRLANSFIGKGVSIMARSLKRIIRHLTCSLMIIVALILITSTANAATIGPYAYIPNNGDNTVSVIDIQTNTVTATVNVGAGPTGVAVSPDGAKVYITNKDDDSVSIINAKTNMVTATVNVGAGPCGAAVTPDETKIYVTNYDDGTVSVINTATNTVAATVNVGVNPTNIVVSPDGTRAYVSNYGSNTVSVIDTTTNTLTATVPVGARPSHIAASPDGTKIYVTNRYSNNISVIDPITNTLIADMTIGSGPSGIAVSPDGTKIYMANIGGSYVSVIDAATNTVIANVHVGSGPFGVALTPDGTRAYVSNYVNNTVSVIDTTTNTLTATVNVGTRPYSSGNFIGPAFIVPTADFCANRTVGVAPMGVQFTDTSMGYASSWAWDFGDGNTSAEQNPVNVFASAGTYSVTLVAINGNGTSLTPKACMITVIAPTVPVADFSANRTTGLAPMGVQFTDESSGYASSWEWSFGDGTTNSTEQDPVHVYASAGTYNVMLTAINDNGTNTMQRTGYVSVSAKSYPTPVTINNLYYPSTPTPTISPSASPAVTATPTATPTAAPTSTTVPSATATAGDSSGNLALWIVILIVAVLAIGAGVYYFVLRK